MAMAEDDEWLLMPPSALDRMASIGLPHQLTDVSAVPLYRLGDSDAALLAALLGPADAAAPPLPTLEACAAWQGMPCAAHLPGQDLHAIALSTADSSRSEGEMCPWGAQ
jgi:hypothetical protein